MYYASKSLKQFMSDEAWGTRTITVPNPDWVVDGEQPELVEVPNPSCHLPEDAVPLPAGLHQSLMQAMADGMVIDWSGDLPAAVERPGPGPADLLRSLQVSAQAALAKKDIVVNRCAERNVPVPIEWAEYADALRVIGSLTEWSPDLALPDQPAYPSGT